MNGTPDFKALTERLGIADPFQGKARTPDVVDAVWWLGLSPLQGCVELGISADLYPKVYRDVAEVVAVYENRKSQGNLDPNEGVPLIRRKRNEANAGLFQGGRVMNVGSRRRA